MKEETANRLICPIVSQIGETPGDKGVIVAKCAGAFCMMWTAIDSSESEGDCALAVRNHRTGRFDEDRTAG